MDNTIWGGNLGDLGWEKITLGGHSMLGEAFRDFQKKLKKLTNLGVQLAISSKNDEKNVLEALERNEEMVLKTKDFVTWKINWEDKAKNIKEIIKELNLSQENILFLDDNIRERMRVKSSLKKVQVPDLPNDPCNFSKFLSEKGYFNFNTTITLEDHNRLKFYKDEFKRKKNKENFISEDSWLKSLQTKITFQKINENNKDRICSSCLELIK